jgi:hypothetical protein
MLRSPWTSINGRNPRVPFLGKERPHVLCVRPTTLCVELFGEFVPTGHYVRSLVPVLVPGALGWAGEVASEEVSDPPPSSAGQRRRKLVGADPVVLGALWAIGSHPAREGVLPGVIRVVVTAGPAGPEGESRMQVVRECRSHHDSVGAHRGTTLFPASTFLCSGRSVAPNRDATIAN